MSPRARAFVFIAAVATAVVVGRFVIEQSRARRDANASAAEFNSLPDDARTVVKDFLAALTSFQDDVGSSLLSDEGREEVKELRERFERNPDGEAVLDELRRFAGKLQERTGLATVVEVFDNPLLADPELGGAILDVIAEERAIRKSLADFERLPAKVVQHRWYGKASERSQEYRDFAENLFLTTTDASVELLRSGEEPVFFLLGWFLFPRTALVPSGEGVQSDIPGWHFEIYLPNTASLYEIHHEAAHLLQLSAALSEHHMTAASVFRLFERLPLVRALVEIEVGLEIVKLPVANDLAVVRQLGEIENMRQACMMYGVGQPLRAPEGGDLDPEAEEYVQRVVNELKERPDRSALLAAIHAVEARSEEFEGVAIDAAVRGGGHIVLAEFAEEAARKIDFDLCRLTSGE